MSLSQIMKQTCYNTKMQEADPLAGFTAQLRNISTVCFKRLDSFGSGGDSSMRNEERFHGLASFELEKYVISIYLVVESVNQKEEISLKIDKLHKFRGRKCSSCRKLFLWNNCIEINIQ